MLDDIARLKAAFAEAEAVFDSAASWEVKFDLLFNHRVKAVAPLLEQLGLSLDWCDPDTTYQEDVSAYFFALKELVEELPGGEDDGDPGYRQVTRQEYGPVQDGDPY